MTPYDRIASNFHADRSLYHPLPKYIDLLVQHLPDHARVLDLGCGTGSPIAEFLVNRGFQITGLDESAEMLAIASALVPSAELIMADMREIQFSRHFAAIIAWDSLFHVDRRDHFRMYDNFAKWLQPGGRLMLSTGGSADEGFTSDMFGFEFYYSSWEPSRVVCELEHRGFEILCAEIDDPSSKGHFAIVAEKRITP